MIRMFEVTLPAYYTEGGFEVVIPYIKNISKVTVKINQAFYRSHAYVEHGSEGGIIEPIFVPQIPIPSKSTISNKIKVLVYQGVVRYDTTTGTYDFNIEEVASGANLSNIKAMVIVEGY